MEISDSLSENAGCQNCCTATEADHRVANHLAVLSGMVRLKIAEMTRDMAHAEPQSAITAMESIRAQIDAVARIHRAMVVEGDGAKLPIDDQLRAVTAPLKALFYERMVITEDLASRICMTPSRTLPLVQIISEVMTNAIKHGAAANGLGGMVVRSRAAADGSAIVEIVDRGPGLPTMFDPTHDGGFGFRLVRSFAKQLGATFEFHSMVPGLTFRLVVPGDGAMIALN